MAEALKSVRPVELALAQETFSQAFAKMQAEIRPAIKDSTNPAFRSKYADLAAIWEAIKQPLANHGFSVIQVPQFEGDSIWLRTMVLHSSGEFIEGRYPLRPVKQDPQGYGSALTYARRYSISAMLGVVADIDDDGNAASTAPNPQREGLHNSPTFTKEQQAPAETRAPLTPQAWAQMGIDRIATFNSREELEAFEDKYQDKIVRLAESIPDMHRKLVDAIADRHMDLDLR